MSQIKHRLKNKQAGSASDVIDHFKLSPDTKKASNQDEGPITFENLSCKTLSQNFETSCKLQNDVVLQCSGSSGLSQHEQKVSNQFWKDKRFLLFSSVLSFMLITLISVILAVYVFEKEAPFKQSVGVTHTLIRHISVENLPDRPYNFNQTFWNSIRGDCGFSLFIPTDPSGRIAGGEGSSELISWPWEVAIVRYRDFGDGYIVHSLLCGGTLIGPISIVTAASCFYNSTANQVQAHSGNLRVVIGQIDLNSVDASKFRRIKSILIHVKNNLISLTSERKLPENDLALVLLEEPLNSVEDFAIINNYICLPLPHKLPPIGKRCWLAGWGNSRTRIAKKNILNEVPQSVISKTSCSSYYGSLIDYEKHLCAQGFYAGPCEGDVGGPLMCVGEDRQWTLYGAVSFSPATCVTGPTVYTSIAKYIEWICCFARDAAPCREIECRYML